MTGIEGLRTVLTALCPMHVVLDATGHIIQAGPTMQKLRPDYDLEGRRFLEVFHLQRPKSVSSMMEMMSIAGEKLHLQFRDAPQTSLKGVLIRVPGSEEVVINLSFGISVLDAVSEYSLTSTDFAATDLTMEMLYLVEAKSAAMEASRLLNKRLQGAKIAAEEQAYTDTLTGLKNRRAMDHILDRLVSAGTPFALMHLDLDFFKAVNDTMGHAAGDHVLQVAARTMVEQTRRDDMVARVGGDEFVLLFQHLHDHAVLESLARRLIARLEEPIPFNDQTCQISASIGTALWSRDDDLSVSDLLEKADHALYAAKNAGRAQHRFYDPCTKSLTGSSAAAE